MKKKSFNKAWNLVHGVSTILEAAFGTGEKKTETVDLPHDALIERPRYAECVSGPGMAYFEGENLQYSKSFRVEAGEEDCVHYLYFDGVYMNAMVLVNNRFVTKHAYGYTPFAVRIDDYLNYGAENEVTVTVRGDAQPNARWYPGLGIYRDVSFLTGPLLHIVPDGIRVTTLACDPETATLEIEADLRNADHKAHTGYALLRVMTDDGETVREDRVKFYVSANDTLVLRTRMDIDGPALWDAEHPDLYRCEVCVCEEKDAGECCCGEKAEAACCEEKAEDACCCEQKTEDACCECVINEKTYGVTDCADTVFGIRTLRFDARHGLRINGKEVKLKGGCIHHDNAMLGARSYPDAELRKIALMKSGGYNAVRTAHNPPSSALLEACDRLGMYVMHEFTDVWPEFKAVHDYGEFFAGEWEQDLEDVVRRDYNHPCIIMWSIGNEIPETGDMISDKWGKKLVDKFKSLDHTRPVTNGINVFVSVMGKMNELLAEVMGPMDGGINDIMFADREDDSSIGDLMAAFASSPKVVAMSEEAADMVDLVGYNYSEDLYEQQHAVHPDRVFYGSETNPPKLDKNWDLVMKHPYVIGDFCWTGWDYLGEVGGGRLVLKEEYDGNFMAAYPWICAYQADFNLIGDRRPVSYWRETIWNGRDHQPYISVHNPARYGRKFYNNAYAWTDSLPCWSWSGEEGKATAVEVYGDADEVEVIVNGTSLGRKPFGDYAKKNEFKKYYAKFETAYQPGEVTAVTYLDGQEAGRMTLKTVGASALCVSADKTSLRAGSDDLCYALIELRDADGTLDMLSDKKVTAVCEGVTLAGMGSGDPKTEEYYQWDTHKFFEGKVLAILKAGETAGPAKVTFRCEGCADVILNIEVNENP